MQQVLPPTNNLLQYYLEDTEAFTNENKMKINGRKSKVILFNKARKYDFPPEIKQNVNANFIMPKAGDIVNVTFSLCRQWLNYRQKLHKYLFV